MLNKSVLVAGTQDPLLAARLAGERKQMERMAAGLAKRTFILPWLTRPPIGFVELSKLVRRPSRLKQSPASSVKPSFDLARLPHSAC